MDPLDTYIPLVLEAKLQLTEAGVAMENDPQLAKSLLREGAFSGLRDNIRAIGEYAEKEGRAANGGAIVTTFFRSLEAYDFLLATSVKSGQLDLPAAQEALEATQAALDAVIALVPEEELQKGQRVLDIILEKSRNLYSDSASEEEAAAAVEDIQQLLP